jgi:tRNA(Arg) A34 adenosine deaminase TadA
MNDEFFLRLSFQIAQKARQHGNHPFGALLVDERGNILLEAENTTITSNDCTGHAETNLMRAASQKYSRDFLATCSLYTSTEPCCMCSGAIFWGNVRRVVFGLRQGRLYELVGETATEILPLTCLEIFTAGNKPIEVIGPLLEDEAAQVHANFWVS